MFNGGVTLRSIEVYTHFLIQLAAHANKSSVVWCGVKVEGRHTDLSSWPSPALFTEVVNVMTPSCHSLWTQEGGTEELPRPIRSHAALCH